MREHFILACQRAARQRAAHKRRPPRAVATAAVQAAVRLTLTHISNGASGCIMVSSVAAGPCQAQPRRQAVQTCMLP